MAGLGAAPLLTGLAGPLVRRGRARAAAPAREARVIPGGLRVTRPEERRAPDA